MSKNMNVNKVEIICGRQPVTMRRFYQIYLDGGGFTPWLRDGCINIIQKEIELYVQQEFQTTGTELLHRSSQKLVIFMNPFVNVFQVTFAMKFARQSPTSVDIEMQRGKRRIWHTKSCLLGRQRLVRCWFV